jgi:aspartate kinase
VAGRVFQAMNGANIRMISQGASSLNLSFVVAGRDLAQAVESLHREFFSIPDPRVFEKRSAAA